MTTYRNLSPTDDQRADIGTTIKMIQDPWNYRRLILYGSEGALMCDDATTTSPTWRLLTLASTSGGGVWSQSFALTVTNGGWTGVNHPPPAAEDGSTTSYVAGTGWRGDLYNTVIVPHPSQSVLDILMTFAGVANLTSVEVKGTGPTNSTYGTAVEVIYDGAPYSPAAYASPFDVTDTRTITATTLEIYCGRGITSPGVLNAPVIVTQVILTGEGTNPFGGSGGGASDEVFIGDMVGTINRKGRFWWLSKKTVGGTDYVYCNRTDNYFASVAKSTQVATYATDMNHSISVSSYSSDVLFVTAGDSGGADCKVYKSTSGGATFSGPATLHTQSGPVNVPYQTGSAGANVGASPAYGVVKGLSGGNLEFIALDGTTNTIVATADYPITAQALNSFTLDGLKMNLVLSGGGCYKTDDGGVTWAATATAVPLGGRAGATVSCLNGSPTNPNYLIASGTKVLAISTDRGATWTDYYAASYDTYRSGALSGGTNIVTAQADMSKLYSKPVTT